MNIYYYMNPNIETTSGFPQTKEDSIKLFLLTYDAKLEMSNRSCEVLCIGGARGVWCMGVQGQHGHRPTVGAVDLPTVGVVDLL